MAMTNVLKWIIVEPSTMAIRKTTEWYEEVMLGLIFFPAQAIDLCSLSVTVMLGDNTGQNTPRF